MDMTLSTPDQRALRWTALAGMAAPATFALVLALLDIVHLDFLVSVGHDPRVGNPVSVNALGPYGWAQNLIFAFLGCAVLALSFGLHRALGGRRPAVGVLLVGGLGISFLMGAFPMDSPDYQVSTWRGWMHGAGFQVTMLTSTLAPFALAWRLRGEPGWRAFARYSLATGVAIVFVLGSMFVAMPLLRAVLERWPEFRAWWGPVGRVHLLLMLAWPAALALNLWTLSREKQ